MNKSLEFVNKRLSERGKATLKKENVSIFRPSKIYKDKVAKFSFSTTLEFYDDNISDILVELTEAPEDFSNFDCYGYYGEHNDGTLIFIPVAAEEILNKFLSNGIKTTSDGKSTVNAIPQNAADRAQEVADLYKELGLGNRAYETYLNLLYQDLIESDNNTFVSTRARSEDHLKRILEEAKGNGKAIPKNFVPPKLISKEVNKLVDNLFRGDPKLSTIDVSKNQLLILRELYKKNPSISTYLKGAKNPEEVQQMINRIVEQGRLYGGYF